MDEKLIEVIAKALRLHPAIEREAAQAALDAIQQYGIVFFKYETAADGTVALKHIDWKDVYEPPAAAITAALKETFKPNPSDNDKPPHNRGP